MGSIVTNCRTALAGRRCFPYDQPVNVLLWTLLAALGLAVAVWGSHRAVDAASKLALGFGISPFVVGVVILSVGTDLPEVANSIVAAVHGNGDILLGDSVGSAVTQVTLILGLLPFFVGGIEMTRRRVWAVGLLTTAALGVLAIMVGDGWMSRGDGLILVALWIAMSIFVASRKLVASEPVITVRVDRSMRLLAVTVVFLGVVTAGAMAAVLSLIEIAKILSAPEFLVSFFGLAIGTSLPELVVSIAALRQGKRDLAIGGLLGSSMVDATLAVGAGPSVAAVAVSASYGVSSSLVAAVVILAVTVVLATRKRHDRKSGLLFILLYAALYPILLAV